jgi:hypothetical protein
MFSGGAAGGAGGGGPVFEYADFPLTYDALVQEKDETGKYPRMIIKRGKVVRFPGRVSIPETAKGMFEFVSLSHFEHETEAAAPGESGHADWEEAKANVASHPDPRSVRAFGEGVSEATAARKSGGTAECKMDTEVKFHSFLPSDVDGKPPKSAIVYLATQEKPGPPWIYANIEEEASFSEQEGDITPQKGVLRKIIDRTVAPSTPLKVRPAGSPVRKYRRKTRKTRKTRRNRRKS